MIITKKNYFKNTKLHFELLLYLSNQFELFVNNNNNNNNNRTPNEDRRALDLKIRH